MTRVFEWSKNMTDKSNIPGPATGVRPAPSQSSGSQSQGTTTRFTDWASI
jgi:hypothetical protein